MSIAAQGVSEAPVAAQTNSTSKKAPPKRQITAKADSVAQPEPR